MDTVTEKGRLAKCFVMTTKYLQVFCGSNIANNMHGTLVNGAMTPRVKVDTEALFSLYSFKFK